MGIQIDLCALYVPLTFSAETSGSHGFSINAFVGVVSIRPTDLSSTEPSKNVGDFEFIESMDMRNGIGDVDISFNVVFGPIAFVAAIMAASMLGSSCSDSSSMPMMGEVFLWCICNGEMDAVCARDNDNGDFDNGDK